MKTTEEMIEIMRAYEEGKEIECVLKSVPNDEWKVTENPAWCWSNFDYRVKEEPKYRPYKDIDELFTDWAEKTHSIPANMEKLVRPLIWIKSKHNGTERLLADYDKPVALLKIGDVWHSLENLFDEYTFLDGSPCGKKE